MQDLRGKVVVLHFVYTSCPDVCPLHAERIAEIQEMVNRTPMRELVQFVTVTADPEHDTSEVMREYGPTHGLEPSNWVFLTRGPDRPGDATRKLAELFGHKFTEAEEDGYQIPNGVVTHVIDREGLWQANFHGLKFGVRPTSSSTSTLSSTTYTRRTHSRSTASGTRFAACFENGAAKLGSASTLDSATRGCARRA